MTQCQDSLDLCQKASVEIDGDEVMQGEELANSHYHQVEEEETYMAQMQHKYVEGEPTIKNPYADNVPQNYFCHYKFVLDTDQTYKVTVYRMYSQDNAIKE